MRNSLFGLLFLCSLPYTAFANDTLDSDNGTPIGRSFHVDWITDVGPGHQLNVQAVGGLSRVAVYGWDNTTTQWRPVADFGVPQRGRDGAAQSLLQRRGRCEQTCWLPRSAGSRTSTSTTRCATSGSPSRKEHRFASQSNPVPTVSEVMAGAARRSSSSVRLLPS